MLARTEFKELLEIARRANKQTLFHSAMHAMSELGSGIVSLVSLQGSERFSDLELW